MHGKFAAQSMSVLGIMMILIASNLGTYSAERELRKLRSAFSDFTIKVLTHNTLQLDDEAHKQLQVLLKNQEFREVMTTVPGPIEGLTEEEVSNIVESFLDTNTPFSGSHPPEIIAHLDLSLIAYTENELRLLEILQIALSLSSIGFTVVILGLILHGRNQEHLTLTLKGLNHQHQDEIEELKTIVSSEIHDKIIQDLALLKIGMESGTSGPNELIRGIEGTISALRRLINGFHPLDAQRIGLVFSVEMLAKSYAKTGQMRVLTSLPLEEEILLSNRAKVHVLRIIQELMSNAMKHADASLMQIILKSEQGRLSISLLDNGKGFDPHTIQSRDSFGMVNIGERIRNLGGEYKYTIRKGSGSRIAINIPMEGVNE